MWPIKAKARLKGGKLKAEVKYPLVGRAKLELGTINSLWALVRVPFLFKANFWGFLKLKKK